MLAATTVLNDPSILVAIVAACGSIAAVIITSRAARRGQDRSREGEQDRLNFDVWRESVEELRTQVEDLRDEVAECHHDKAALDDEVGGMKASNQALRMRVAVLEAHVESLTGRKIGGNE